MESSGIQTGKEEIKLSLFIYNMMSYKGNPMESTRKRLRLRSEFRKLWIQCQYIKSIILLYINIRILNFKNNTTTWSSMKIKKLREKLDKKYTKCINEKLQGTDKNNKEALHKWKVHWIHRSETSIWLRVHFPQSSLYINTNPFKIPAVFFINFTRLF